MPGSILELPPKYAEAEKHALLAELEPESQFAQQRKQFVRDRHRNESRDTRSKNVGPTCSDAAKLEVAQQLLWTHRDRATA